MKLSTQIGASLALLLLVIAALAGWQLLLIGRLQQANQQLASADLEVSRTSLRMRLEIDRLTDLTQRFFVLRDPAYRGELRRVRSLLAVDLAHLQGLPLEPAVEDSLVPLTQRWSRYRALAEDLEAAVPNREEPEDAREQLLGTIRDLRHSVDSLDREAVERVAASIADSTAGATQARRLAFLVGAIAVLLVATLALWISRSTIRPLRAVATGARAISEGDFGHRVPVKGPHEVRSLADDFNRMAGRLGDLERMKHDFVSSVSHDLKAPLASMQETTRLLLEGDERVDSRRLLELNAQSAERLQLMIDDLLDVARLDAGAAVFELEILDLVSHVRQVLDEASGLLDAGQLRLQTNFPQRPVRIEADSRFLLQALWNLVSNAIKFSPEGSLLSAWIRPIDRPDDLPAAADEFVTPSALLSIADRGPGIPDEDKPHVFERFFRSRRHERFASGTGLGLAIVASIVNRLGGTIWVEDAVGGGSVFCVLLPTVVATSETTTP